MTLKEVFNQHEKKQNINKQNSLKEYDTKAALHFIKKNYEKYKIIDPEDRKEFEEMFGALAKEEIYRLKRYLEAEEINILAQRIRIRQFQLKEKEGKKIIGKKAGKEDIQEWSQQKTQLFIKIIRENIIFINNCVFCWLHSCISSFPAFFPIIFFPSFSFN